MPYSTPEDSHRRKALRMPYMWESLHPEYQSYSASAGSYGCQTSQLTDMRDFVYALKLDCLNFIVCSVKIPKRNLKTCNMLDTTVSESPRSVSHSQNTQLSFTLLALVPPVPCIRRLKQLSHDLKNEPRATHLDQLLKFSSQPGTVTYAFDPST